MMLRRIQPEVIVWPWALCFLDSKAFDTKNEGLHVSHVPSLEERMILQLMLHLGWAELNWSPC